MNRPADAPADDAVLLDRLDPDAVRLLTGVVRGERFGDGCIAGGLENGSLAFAVRVLEARPAHPARPTGRTTPS
ncbi:DUF6508 domain-containing protein [Streptomyces sp. BH097]|uniref:DUF6508 domain-containing protein n=1 Tax=unclassified Streptomyces TaxID=2593676 RepID=UPI003BB70EFA